MRRYNEKSLSWSLIETIDAITLVKTKGTEYENLLLKIFYVDDLVDFFYELLEQVKIKKRLGYATV